MIQFEYTIQDELGIHARPAGLLVNTAKGLNSRVTIAKGEKTADADKLFAVMGLGIKQNDTVTVTVSGGDETTAAQAMQDFLQKNL